MPVLQLIEYKQVFMFYGLSKPVAVNKSDISELPSCDKSYNLPPE
jgi:hypothetical protein